MQFAPVMLALLLALSPGAVALQAAAPTAPVSDATGQTETVVVPDNDTDVVGDSDTEAVRNSDSVRTAANGNTTNVMTLGTAPARSAFDSPPLTLGGSLALDRSGFRTILRVNALDQRLAAADSLEMKKQILNRHRFRIENRIISLKAEERRATQKFSNGTISERKYLWELGRIDAEADEVRDAIDVMEDRSTDISPRFTLESEARTLEGKLVTVEGPVRDRISKVIRGEASRMKVYVATSDSGVILATIMDNTYVREIVREELYDPTATPNLTPIEAQDIVFEQYSWAFDNLEGANTEQIGSTNIIFVSVSHPHGNIEVYVDDGTKKIFKEVQHKRLTGDKSLPPGPAVSNSSENVTLTVHQTYPGGPLRVKLTNATGEPLDGRITVAGKPVGRTHGNGFVWTLGPSEEFRVSATYEDTTVNVTTTPVEADS